MIAVAFYVFVFAVASYAAIGLVLFAAGLAQRWTRRPEPAPAVDVVAEEVWTEADDAALARYAQWARSDDQNMRIFREGEL